MQYRMLKVLTGCILKIYPYRTLLKGYENFCTPPENVKGAPYLTLLLEGVSLQLEAERDTLAFKGHCKNLASNMYRKVQLRQN